MAHANPPRHPYRRALGVAAALVAVLVGASACAGTRSDSKSSSATQELPARPDPATEGRTAPVADSANSGGIPGEQPDAAQPLGLDGSARLLVIEASVVVEVADVGNAVGQVVDLAAEHGGQVYDSQVDLGDPRYASGLLVVRLPPAEMESAIADLAAIGAVISRTQSTDDVTDQVVDLDARILTARASVDSVRALMATTKDLNQLVFLESELTNRQTVLEQLVAQQRNLANDVAQATLTVQLTTAPVPAPLVVVGQTDHRPSVGEAFAKGWTAFVRVLVAVAVAIGYASPFLAVLVILTGVAMLIRRVRRPRRSRSVAPLLPPTLAEDRQTIEPDSVDAARTP